MRHALLAHGCSVALFQWLEETRAEWKDAGLLTRLQLRYGAFWFERLLKAQAAQPVSAAAEPDVAFVMGFWRSGTTLLHNLLYAGWRCRTALTWECFSPASFRLQSPPRIDIVTQRPMDGGIVRLLGPQEDEFATLLLGELSLYRGFLDPNRLEALANLVVAPAVPAYPRWRHFVTSLAASPTEKLLLKSPNHMFRLPAIRAYFPTSRSVWIGRNFSDVYRSNLLMWSAMAERYALTRFSPAVIERFAVRIAAAYADVLRDLLERPAESLLWVDFDRLVARPDYEATRVAEYFGYAPRHAAERILISADPQIYSSSLARSDAAGSAEVNRIVAQVDALHEAARAHFARG